MKKTTFLRIADIFLAAAGCWLKLVLFYWLVLCLFRVLFVVFLQEYAVNLNADNLATVLVVGGRLSLQTAVQAATPVFVPTVAAMFGGGSFLKKASMTMHCLTLFCLTFLFAASVPFYTVFQTGFNQMLFVGANEDAFAIFVTCVEEYGLLWRVLAVFAAVYALWQIWRRFAAKNFTQKAADFVCAKCGTDAKRLATLFGAVQIAVVYAAVTLAQYGGAWSWEKEITWENAGVTNDALLNEAILDGAQALNRAIELNRRLTSGEGLAFSAADIKSLAATLTGKDENFNDLRAYLTKHADGAKIAKPTHIFVILGESYANWPLLPQYENLHIADGARKIIADGAIYCPVFLPNGISTVSAVTGVCSGLADANLYLTSMPRSFAAPFETASAPIMQRLGYRADFWYAGPPSWENIGAFVLAQGFQNFYGRGDLGEGTGSVWGIDDEYLYAKIAAHLDDAPSFNVILTASNHAPYEVNLKAKGFAANLTKKALPPNARDDKQLLRELGHFWYADRELAKFVATVQKKYPDSLFVIVGDHANRYHISKTPNLYESYCVPLIIAGANVYGQMLSPRAVGSHIDIVPTIAELIAPKNFAYMSIGSSLTTNDKAVNYLLFAQRDKIGTTTDPLTAQNLVGEPTDDFDASSVRDYVYAIRGISFYLAKFGTSLE